MNQGQSVEGTPLQPTQNFFQKYWIYIILTIAALGFAVMTVVFLSMKDSQNQDQSNESGQSSNQSENNSESNTSDAIKAGKALSNQKCEGEGAVPITHSPMDPEDFSILIPYGLVVGGHVTPIDHQYFAPKEYNSPRDSYNVYAVADGTIVDIGPRDRTNPNDPNDKFQEYRIVFSHTCTFLTYFDLVTSLEPSLKAEYDKVKNDNGYANEISYLVKAGDLIGKIGGQTLDFAVWDTEKPLTGFVTPSLYNGEAWKIYTANPYDYMTKELKALLIERNPRTIEPIEGKIDYDQPGKLVGNWFEEGTNGYAGTMGEGGGEYWKGHLSLAPNHYDPSVYMLSFGDINGEALQFVAQDLTFNPSTLSSTEGVIKINLAQAAYVDSQGEPWNGNTITKSPKITISNSIVYGCVLFQVLDGEKLKMETFVGQECANVSDFTNNLKMYYR